MCIRDRAITTLCQQLQASAGVTFPSIPQLPLNSLLCNNYVVVPAGNSAVSQGVISFSAHVPNVQQAQSTDRNRIYWYNPVSYTHLQIKNWNCWKKKLQIIQM